jgi:hypothetical protein
MRLPIPLEAIIFVASGNIASGCIVIRLVVI